jgi:rhamnogalacturonyl hydrolase YesR
MRFPSLLAFTVLLGWISHGLLANPLAPRIALDRVGRSLEIKATLPPEISEVEVRIASDRNQRITKISDRSVRNPSPAKPIPEREVFYAIVDVRLDAGMEGVMRFSAAPLACFLNQHVFKSPVPVGKEVTLPASALNHWENAVFVAPGNVAAEGFHLRFRAPVIHGRLDRQVQLLSDPWAGRISLHAIDGAELAHARVTAPSTVASAAVVPTGEPLSTARLHASLTESIRYTLRSQEQTPTSPFFGGLNLFYDLDATTYRSNYWIWGWGPSVRMLIDAESIPEVARHFAPGTLKRVADEIGQASLRFVVTDATHPARGIPVSRWNRGLSFPTGFEERISASDAQFLSGWAWLPLYHATGNAAYLEAAKTLTEATERLTGEHGIIWQDYYEETKKWADYFVDESGFATEGVAELYAVTRDPRHRDIGLTYFDRVREKLERPDGIWNRGWNRKSGMMSAAFITRGMGWAMEGLLAAHRMKPDGGYLHRAKILAEHLLRWQHADGSWSINADRPASVVGTAEKATALWSLLFYRLYHETRDPRHLTAARKALTWGVVNQYTGPDLEARGSVVGSAHDAGVGYRAWFPLSCTYTSAFFALAAMEELRLQAVPTPAN